MNRRKSGLTLIEILIVVVIIGMFTAIVIPKITTAKAVATMKNDLQGFVNTQEKFMTENGGEYFSGVLKNLGRYEKDRVEMKNKKGEGVFLPAEGVTLYVTSFSGRGWYAIATHPNTTKACGIFIGKTGIDKFPEVSEEGKANCASFYGKK